MLPEELVLRALQGRRQGAVVAYVGPAGIGKTYAAKSLVQRAAVTTYILPASLPLSGWPVQLPRPRHLASWIERGLERGPDDSWLAALSGLLAALAPLSLLVEDLHDAEPEQQEVIFRLARRASRARGVALILTSRQALPTDIPAQTVEVLSQEGSVALVAHELGEGVPDAAISWIHARALGNPLFTLEYLRFLVRSGHLYSDSRRWHWRVPESGRVPARLEALIAQTLGRADEHRAILDARAVVPDASLAEWAAVADLTPAALQAGMDALSAQGLLDAGQRLIHPLYAEVLRNGLSTEQRAALAARAVNAYTHDPLRAALHLDAARLAPEQALALLERAAQQAEQQGLSGQAGRLLARASDLQVGSARTGLALRAARLLQGTDLPRSLDLALRVLEDPALAAEALPIAAAITARTGGRAALDALLRRLPAELHRPAAALSALQTAGDHAGVLALWETLGPQEQVLADDHAQQAVTLSLVAVGRNVEAAARLNSALAGTLSETTRLNLQATQVLLLYHQEQYRQAADLATATAAGLERVGNSARASALHHNGAAFLRMLGEFGEALISVRRALDTRLDLGDVRGYASSLGLLGELELEQGRFEAAEDALSEALVALTYLDATHFLLNNLSMLTTLYTLSDAPLSVSLALHHAGRALDTARDLGNPRLLVETLTDASRAFTRAGQGERGLALAEEAARCTGDLDTDERTHARIGLARGLALEALGRVAEASASLIRAESVARQAQGDYEADKIALEVARLHGARSDLERLAERFESRGQGLGSLLARRALGSPLPGAARASLCILGPLTLDGLPVRGQQRRALLLRLLAARLTGRSEVERLTLTDELYPGRPEALALGALRQTVATLRADLGPHLVVTTAGGYALGAVQSDAEAFLARPDLAAWRGPLPPEADESLREALHRALRQAALEAVAERPEAAARAGQLLLESDPFDKSALRLTLTALRRAGNHRSLTRLYARARTQYSDLGVEWPERWQDFLEHPAAGQDSPDGSISAE
ncbi:tetratricopeptide repeat protein [Deinococcus sp. UYEF24]